MRRYLPKTSLTDAERRKLDYVVSIHGPGIQAMTAALNRFQAAYNQTHSEKLTGGHAQIGRLDPNYLDISLIRDPDKLPDVIGGMAFGEFLGQGFQERFVRRGVFESAAYSGPVHPLFRGLQCSDRSGSYHIYGACAFTMLVDRRKLNGRPVPRTWAQLLSPDYRDMVVLGFHLDDINEVHLLYIYKLFGRPGLEALVRNLSALMDTLDMMRLSLREKNTNAIYLLPHFFAEAAPKEPYMEIVWPEDGALLCPLYYLARNIELPGVRAVLDFLTGPELGSVLTEKNFFHIHPAARTAYDDKQFLWLGWDYLLQHDIIMLMREIDEIVVPMVIRKFPGIERTAGRALWNG